MQHLFARYNRGFGWAISVLGLSTGMLSGCKKEPEAGAPPEMITLVSTTQVSAKDVPVYLDEIGTVVASETVEIRPQAAGKVIKIDFEDGADIPKGKELFYIEPTQYKANLAQANAILTQSDAQARQAESDYDRVKGLSKEAVSDQDKEAKKSAWDVAVAQKEAASAQVTIAKAKLAYCTIVSPIEGRAGKRLVDVGNVVSDVNPPPMLIIQKLDPIYVDFTVTENDLTEVRRCMASQTLKVEARLPGDEKASDGTLTFLDNSVQDGTGTVKLRATIKNPDQHFWPGQFVEVRLVLSTEHNVPVIPAVAVQVGQDGPYVYVVNPDAKGRLRAQLHTVTLGQPQGDKVRIQPKRVVATTQKTEKAAPSMIAVKAGVRAGDRLVTAGQMLLMPEAAVREDMTGKAAVPTRQPGGDKPAVAPTTQRSAARGSTAETNTGELP